MIVIKLEIWPKGDHTRARNLGTAAIWNVGGDADTGDYECRLFKSPEYSRTNAGRSIEEMCTRPLARETWRKGRVEGFLRARLGPWDLLFRALGAMIRDRNLRVTDGGNASFEEGGLPADGE
jgi:hypothetical protein